ncbi:hypothetical protein Sjap_009475 [Stephania japonica]|uniref:Uncharacterized protein n=1 Tax=Stephania japonica TaxID=461633 RepID=A0AAP0PFG9_9MAGN
MAPMCLNNTKSDTDQFSSPVPIIGLYIAGATLVCLLLMLFDILSGLRRSVRYIPCRLFSLNSATLSLLGIASKLPVDLTTYMPSAIDQLSKLTGTTMICIAMGFFMPSLGTSSETERITNMIALSFLVVTVSVNICIQVSTKLIFSFHVEHVLIVCFMLSLLVVFWFSNPQLTLIRGVSGLPAGPICVFCSVILSQAAFRSLVLNDLKFCRGVSDYGKWSMWMIIITQISITLIGSIAIAFRWLTFVSYAQSFMQADVEYIEYYKLIIQFSVMRIRSIKTTIMVTSRFLINCGLILIFLLASAVPWIVFRITTLVLEKCSCASFYEKNGFLNCLTMACIKDMNKWMNNTVKRFSSLSSSYTVQMLSRRNPSAELLLNKFRKRDSDEYEGLTCLSMTLLVKIVVVSMPSNLSESLRRTLDEAFEIIYFIDKKINVGKVKYRNKRRLAKLLWKGGEIRLSKDSHSDSVQQGVAVSNALSTLLEVVSLTNKTGSDMREETKKIENFIQERSYTSTEELCDYIEQVFVEMLHWYLQQLPDSILKHVNESLIEENEERARTVLKLLYKLDPLLEDKVQWIFPEGTNITSIFDLHD